MDLVKYYPTTTHLLQNKTIDLITDGNKTYNKYSTV